MLTIAEMIEIFQDTTNEATITPAKYTAAKIVKLLNRCAPIIATEAFRVADGPASVRWNLVVVADQSTYARPANMGEIVRIAKMDDRERIVWKVDGSDLGSRWNPQGPGWVFDGPTIRVEPLWRRGETMQIWFVPNGEFYFAQGAFTGSSTVSTLYLGTETYGVREPRENAYAGYVVDVIYANGLKVSRAVESSNFDGTNHTLSVAPDLATAPDATSTYVMAPLTGEGSQVCIAKQAAIEVLRDEGMDKHEAAVTRSWRQLMRNLRLTHGNLQNISGMRYTEDNYDGGNFFIETLN